MTQWRDDLEDVLRDVNIASPSTTKFSPLEAVVATTAAVPRSQVVAVTVRKAGNATVRSEQSERARSARLLVFVVPDVAEVPGTRRVAERMVQEGRCPAILVLNEVGGHWTAVWMAVRSDLPSDDLAGLRAVVNEVTEVDAAADLFTQVAATPATTPDLTATDTQVAPLRLDQRLRRVLQTTIASNTAMMLVGPPGTGKSQLAAEIVEGVTADPHRYGMSVAHDRLAVTPDESWTTRELVGGETVDDEGRLRFTPGYVLQAIAQDRWLILDEANRADLDRIFGGLLTWLSGQTVTVGRVSSHPDAAPVRLGWNDGPLSVVVGEDQLTDPNPSGDPVVYLAGSEWRLIGTYNAVDAQRVFRLGLALGRRFAQVPVPAPTVDQFTEALADRLDALGDRAQQVSDAVVALYRAHQAVDHATLGPAMFLSMPGYVEAGLRLNPAVPLDDLLAEAYLVSVGSWLARLDDPDLDELRTAIGSGAVFTAAQWQWIAEQLTAMQ